MTWHPSCDRVDGKFDSYACFFQSAGEFSKRVLRLRGGHSIARHKDNLASVRGCTTRSSALASRMAPSSAVAFASETFPNAPKGAVIDLFMARHMTIERMNPEPHPSVPGDNENIIRNGKADGSRGQACAGVEQAITTGISAEPIGSTSKTPKTKERITAGKRGALHRVEKSKR